MSQPASTSSTSSSTPASSHSPATCPEQVVDQVDMAYLQSLLGFNARMASLHLIGVFMQAVAEHGLRAVDFSILSVVHHNPGITSSQLCACLNLLPPNLVSKIRTLEKQGWLIRQPHPQDGRAQGLHLTPTGQTRMAQAEARVLASEAQALSQQRLSPAEQATLRRLLCRVYAARP